MRAIDVSAYQGKPDWSKVKKAGVSAAILRIANRKGKDESTFIIKEEKQK